MPASKVLEGLKALLDTERNAIRSGDFADLEKIAARKAELLGLLERALRPEYLSRLEAIKKSSGKNQHLLTAALKGIDAARSRVMAIKTASTSLTTYDSRGRANSILASPSAVERRA